MTLKTRGIFKAATLSLELGLAFDEFGMYLTFSFFSSASSHVLGAFAGILGAGEQSFESEPGFHGVRLSGLLHFSIRDFLRTVGALEVGPGFDGLDDDVFLKLSFLSSALSHPCSIADAFVYTKRRASRIQLTRSGYGMRYTSAVGKNTYDQPKSAKHINKRQSFA
jgi:hypothetical protein